MYILLETLSLDTTKILEKDAISDTHFAYDWLSKITDMALDFAPKLLGAIVIYIVGKWIINWVSRLMKKMMKRKHFDPSLQSFLASLVKISLLVLLALTAIGVLGVNITSFAALLAGAGLAIGSALNGSLGNFAGGVMILLTKPFKLGDLIEAQGHFGIVREIGIVDTTILTSQNKTIHLPNGALSTGVIMNYTAQDNFRMDLKIAVKDGTDIEFARKVAVEAMLQHPNVLKDPAPMVKVAELTGDGPVIVLWPRIQIKPYDPKQPRLMEADYYSVYFGVRELVYTAFVKNNIQTPDTTFEGVVHNVN